MNTDSLFGILLNSFRKGMSNQALTFQEESIPSDFDVNHDIEEIPTVEAHDDITEENEGSFNQKYHIFIVGDL